MKIQNISNSKISIARKLGERIDLSGAKWIKVNWEILKKEVVLGSCKNPNKDILLFKIEVE